jgi:caa(3)-type oxidase subunit IV
MSQKLRPHSFLTYVILALLLGASILLSRLPLNSWKIAFILLLASAQGTLMILNFMRVRLQGHLIYVAAGASFVWLGILFALSFGDYLTRKLVW